MFKSGFVAIIGKPSVGKSTLVNALVGQKIAITSPKPQTTRNKIIGIKNGDGYQIIFVDTPGMHNGESKLSSYLKKSVETATNDVDAILIVLSASNINSLDYDILEKYKNTKTPVFVVINKIDMSSFEKLYPVLSRLNEYSFVKKFITISALKQKNIDEIVSSVLQVLPEGPAYFDESEVTDKSVRFMASEIIREKALLFLKQELPHGIAIDIIKFKEQPKKVDINADIICESDRHKEIIIGSGGAMIKKIGTSARIEIEKLVEKPVNLQLFVKVRADWKQNSNMLADLGYNIKDL